MPDRRPKNRPRLTQGLTITKGKRPMSESDIVKTIDVTAWERRRMIELIVDKMSQSTDEEKTNWQALIQKLSAK